ncbi:MAG: response regulator [Gallionellaceae bacterium]
MSEENIVEKATILLVDDAPEDLLLMSNLLKDYYTVKVANCGEKGIMIAMSDTPPDLILLDITMPGMDGYEVCWRLKHDHKTLNIPVIFITGKSDIDAEKKGLELGAVDFLVKPVNPEIVLARVKNQLALKIKSDRLQGQNDSLEIEVAQLQHPLPIDIPVP